MVGLSRIGLHVPEERESVPALMRELGRPEPEILRFDRLFNLQTVPVERERRLEDLLQGALADLAVTEQLDAVGLVLFAHSALPQVPPDHDLFGRTLSAVGLREVPAYGIAHVNCAALFRAVELAEGWLAHSSRRPALVLAGDLASFIPEARLLPGASAMGDAAIAFLLRRTPAPFLLRGRAWRQDTRFHRGIRMNAEEAMAFNGVYLELLGEVIDDALSAAGLALGDVDCVLPHNVNALTWTRFARERGFDRERIFMDLIPAIGHTMTTDAFVNLEVAARWHRIGPGDRCLLVGVGTGSYFAAMVVELTDAVVRS